MYEGNYRMTGGLVVMLVAHIIAENIFVAPIIAQDKSESPFRIAYKRVVIIGWSVLPLAPFIPGCIGDKGGNDLWPYWIPVLIFETTLVALAIGRSIFYGLSRYGTPRTLSWLVRDSILYFGGTAAFMLANFVIWIAARVSYSVSETAG